MGWLMKGNPNTPKYNYVEIGMKKKHMENSDWTFEKLECLYNLFRNKRWVM